MFLNSCLGRFSSEDVFVLHLLVSDLLQLVDGRTAAIVAADGGDGAVDEGGQGDHHVEEDGGRLLGHGDLGQDLHHVFRVSVLPRHQLPLPQTQTLLQQSNTEFTALSPVLSHLD